MLDDHGSIARFENSQLEAFVVHSVPTCLQQLLLMDSYLTVHTLDQLPEKLSTEKELSLERTCRGQGFLYLADATRPIESKQFMEYVFYSGCCVTGSVRCLKEKVVCTCDVFDDINKR